MTTIDAYSGISQKEIEAERITSEGKIYNLNHPSELLVPMRYFGESHSNSNSQGWERNNSYYFEQLRSNHPDFFSKKNVARIENGEAPKVDAQFVKNFPQYKGFENETLIHHHIGKDGQAVAVPSGIHKGSGEIHTYENALGVTKNAQRFSSRCGNACSKNGALLGKTSEEFKSLEAQKTAGKSNAFTKTINAKGQGAPLSNLSEQNAFTESTKRGALKPTNNYPSETKSQALSPSADHAKSKILW